MFRMKKLVSYQKLAGNAEGGKRPTAGDEGCEVRAQNLAPLLHPEGGRVPPFIEKLQKLIVFVLLFCFFQTQVSLWGKPPKGFSFQELAASLPALEIMDRKAKEFSITFGIWGGTVRDLFLGRPFTIISDCDLIYNSDEKGFPDFRNFVLDFSREYKGNLPSPDFHFDLSEKTSDNERLRTFHQEGITATKVGVLGNGEILDPTGLGIKDLRARFFRYYPPDKRVIELHNLGRFIRDMVRLHSFRRDAYTVDLLRSSLKKFAEEKVSAAGCRAKLSNGNLIVFPKLISAFRDDTRFLHNNLDERTEFFPLDLFIGDIFKSITQADDMESMREVFAYLGTDKFMRSVGLAPEADLIMDPANTREDLFARFMFPGFQPEMDLSAEPFLPQWERTLRKYSYRVFFDMLASEFPPSSYQAKHLKRRRDDFLKPSTYRLQNPGDAFDQTIFAFLDPDFNVFVLPREKVEKSLYWFLKTYLPFGKRTLIPLPPDLPGTRRVFAEEFSRLQVGYSDEIAAIDRDSAHSFRDLDEYLRFQIGEELVELLCHPRTTVGFFAANADTTRAILFQLGYTSQFHLNSPGFSRRKRTILGFDAKKNRVMVAYYHFFSDQQLLNHQARVYFLRRKIADKGPESVFVLRSPVQANPEEERTRQFLESLPCPVDTVFFGFTNPLKRILENPEKITLGEVVLWKGFLPGSSKTRLVLGLSGFGASYGSFPGMLLSNLKKFGVKNVVFIGTGGGLSGGRARYSWAIPDRVLLAETKLGAFQTEILFNNSAFNLPLANSASRVKHASVISPLQETRLQIDSFRNREIGTVDCELYYLIREIGSFAVPPKIFALINLTDFPSGNKNNRVEDFGEISGVNSSVQFQRTEEAVSQIVAALVNGPLTSQ